MTEHQSSETPTCAVCTHFASDDGRDRIVQISIRGAGGTEDAPCAHPSHRPLRLRVRPHQSCSSFESTRRAG